MGIDEILRFLSPVTVGFVAAYLGSTLALNKFKKEKLWEEKRAIYKEIIEAFEELMYWAEYVRSTHCCEPSVEADTKFDESLRLISKHSATGGLMLSGNFQKKLEEANLELNKTWFQISNESLSDMDSERDRAEWLFILSKEIKGVVVQFLPELISIAKNEIPK